MALLAEGKELKTEVILEIEDGKSGLSAQFRIWDVYTYQEAIDSKKYLMKKPFLTSRCTTSGTGQDH